MKNTLILFSALLMTLILPACQSEAYRQLKTSVEQMDKECPIDLGSLGTMETCVLDEASKNVDVTIQLSGVVGANTLKILKEASDITRDQLRVAHHQQLSEPDFRIFIESLIETGVSLTYNYLPPTPDGNTYSITFTAEQLKDAVDNPLMQTEIDRISLNNTLTMERLNCPYSTGTPGLDITSVAVENDYVIYTVTTDESLYNLDSIEQNIDAIKQNIRATLRNNPAARAQCEIFNANGLGLTYRYLGSESGRSLDIQLAPHSY